MKKNQKISQELQESILNYSNEIETIEDFVAGVRNTPGWYIGPIGNLGFINMIREILQNSFDEIMKGKTLENTIVVSYDPIKKEVCIIDSGRGIPHENIVRIFTEERTSSNYTKKSGEFSSGAHGVGSKVVNALSKYYTVDSCILGVCKRVEFIDGKPWDKGDKFNELLIKDAPIYQGTIVTFAPAEDVLGEITCTWEDVYNLIALLLPTTMIGTTVEFHSFTPDGKEVNDTLVNEDGLMKFIIESTSSPLMAPIIINNVVDDMKVDILLTYDLSDIGSEYIVAFGNYCPIKGGTHVDGFKEGLANFFRNYMNKVYLAGKKTKVTIINTDIYTGLRAVVSASHLHPIFTGQSKEILSNAELKDYVKNVIMNGLDEWAKSNPKDLQKVCGYLKDIATARLAADKEKVKITNKYAGSSLTGLPKKYVAPTGTKEDGLELFIVEGDSAKGPLTNNRINKRQGVMPIRGKIPNAFDKSKQEFLANAEVAGIIAILDNGVGKNYGNNMDVSKCPFEKIIFAADADPDGKHINSLLLRFFLLYLRPLIEDGRVYKAVPPLYSIPLGKKKFQYFTDKMDYINYILKQFSKSYEISSLDGNKMNAGQVADIIFRNMDYDYELESLAANHALNPFLLEKALIEYKNKDMFNILKKDYRFLNKINIQGIDIMQGLVDNKINTIFMNDKLLHESKIVLRYIENINLTNQYIKLNGQLSTIYGLMKEFRKFEPSSLNRYKGLGEMDGYQLFDSTIDPTKRTLVRYTIENAVKEIEQIRHFENNKNELLIGLDNLSRMEVIG